MRNPKNHLRVYYVDGVPAQASARYRVFNALEQLRLAGVQGALLTQDYHPDKALAGPKDVPGVLVIHRAPWDERLAALIERARAQGIKVLFDIDDLVFDPIALPWIRALSRLSESELELYEDGVRRYFRAMRACDAVLTTTRALASFVAAEGLPAFIHRNGLDLRSLDTAQAARQARTPRDEVVLYYGAGTATHDVDFQQCGAALERLLRKHSALHLLVQGDVVLSYGLELLSPRIRRWPWMPWPDYFWGIAQADINLAPLETGNPFCEVKSELKWFEAALLGLPTVATATAAFAEVIRPGENGFLARTEGEWFDVLDELVGNHERRQAVAARAEADAMSQYHPAAMGRQLADLLSRVARSEDLAALAGEMEERALVRGQRPRPTVETKREATDSRPERRLTIGWLATAPVKGGGGTRNILRMARHLQSFGHDVTLYVDPLGLYRSEKELVSFIQSSFPGDPIRVVMGLQNTSPSDALIATFWLTAYALRDIHHCREKFYLVQDYEPYFYAMGEEYLRAEATYRFGFHHISSGPWCAQVLRERFSARADHFDFPLDRSIYYPRPAPESRPQPRVLFFSRPEMSRRCYNMGIEALARLKARMPEAHVTLFGSDQVDTRSVPFPCENLKNIVDLNRLAELYSAADAALVLSTTNSSLVPFEVAASGCPVVDFDLEVNRANYHGSDAMLLMPPEPEAMAEALYRLLDDSDLRQRHREAGFRLVETLPNEEQAARRVEEIIFQGLGLLPSPTCAPAAVTPAGGRSGSLDGLALDVTCRREDAATDELMPGREIAQTFRCNASDLAAVAVRVAAHGRRNACSLELSLYEHGAATPATRVCQSVADCEDNGWLVFRFAPLGDSSGKDYRLVVSSPDAGPGNAVGLLYSRSTLYREGSLQLNGRAAKGALVFQTFAERADADEMRRLLKPEQARPPQGADEGAPAEGGAQAAGGAAVAALRQELRALRKSLDRLDRRQSEVTRQVMDMHNLVLAVRGSLPYRAARKVARLVRPRRR